MTGLLCLRSFGRIAVWRFLPALMACMAMFPATWLFADDTDFVAVPPSLDAKAWLLADESSGKILADHEIDKKLPAAGLVKLMTAYVTLAEASDGVISLEDMAPISRRAANTRPARMYLEEGSKVPLTDLLPAIIIAARDDACVAIAEYLAGDESAFAELMNHRASLLGMSNSHFLNSTGADAGRAHVTARDMFRLALRFINDYPEHYALFREKKYTRYADQYEEGKITWRNKNTMLWRSRSVDGILGDDSYLAGYNFIASATRNGMRLIAIVMGAPNFEQVLQQAQRLLTYGFRNFETYEVLASGIVDTVPLRGANQNTLGVKITKAVVLTVPRGQHDSLRLQVRLPSRELWAPLAEGQRVGQITLELGAEVLHSAPLVTSTEAQAAGFFKRSMDHVRSLFSNFENSSP